MYGSKWKQYLYKNQLYYLTLRKLSVRFFPSTPRQNQFSHGIAAAELELTSLEGARSLLSHVLRACAPLSHLSSTSKILLELVSPCFDHCDTFSVEFSGSIDKKESDDEIRRRDLFPIVVIPTRILKRKKLLLPVSVDSWFDWILCCNIALHNFQLRLDQCF